MKLKTIRVVPVRAVDLPEGAIVRRTGTSERWRYLYENVVGGEKPPYGTDLMRTNTERLDSRWVQLRLADDPVLTVPSYQRRGAVVQEPVTEPPSEHEDIVRVELAHELYDVQVVVEVDTAGLPGAVG